MDHTIPLKVAVDLVLKCAFSKESSTFLLTDPSLVLVRTQVLDYFEDQRKHVKDDCILFRWERSMTLGSSEKELLDRVSLEMGYPRGYAGEYLTGVRGEFLRDFPELDFPILSLC